MRKWVPRVEYDEAMVERAKKEERHLARVEAAKNPPKPCNPDEEECPEIEEVKEDWSSWAKKIKL